MFRKPISLIVAITFICSMVTPVPKAQAQNLLGLPEPGVMVSLSPAYEPALIKGLTVHKDNPFLFDFIVDTGNSHLAGDALKKEGDRLIKYFFAALTIPDQDLWVNLSPYEKDRMIPQALGQTALGRDLLAQDYMLKQLTASLIYPEKELGKSFWDKVYAQAREQFGTTSIPVNTFNKVWIIAENASVYEHNQTAFIVSGHLKVMLEEDYTALVKHSVIASEVPPTGHSQVAPKQSTDKSHALASQIVRSIILPAIENEVNTGKNFAMLRQMFYSQILATWFKRNLKQALLSQVYADKSTVNGVNLQDPSVKEKIYQRYLQAYKKGAFNFIKEDVDPVTQQSIPRKYFSGGEQLAPASIGAATISEARRAAGDMAQAVDFRAMLTTGDAVRGMGSSEGRAADAALLINNKKATALKDAVEKYSKIKAELTMLNHHWVKLRMMSVMTNYKWKGVIDFLDTIKKSRKNGPDSYKFQEGELGPEQAEELISSIEAIGFWVPNLDGADAITRLNRVMEEEHLGKYLEKKLLEWIGLIDFLDTIKKSREGGPDSYKFRGNELGQAQAEKLISSIEETGFIVPNPEGADALTRLKRVMGEEYLEKYLEKKLSDMRAKGALSPVVLSAIGPTLAQNVGGRRSIQETRSFLGAMFPRLVPNRRDDFNHTVVFDLDQIDEERLSMQHLNQAMMAPGSPTTAVGFVEGKLRTDKGNGSWIEVLSALGIGHSPTEPLQKAGAVEFKMGENRRGLLVIHPEGSPELSVNTGLLGELTPDSSRWKDMTDYEKWIYTIVVPPSLENDLDQWARLTLAVKGWEFNGVIKGIPDEAMVIVEILNGLRDNLEKQKIVFLTNNRKNGLVLAELGQKPEKADEYIKYVKTAILYTGLRGLKVVQDSYDNNNIIAVIPIEKEGPLNVQNVSSNLRKAITISIALRKAILQFTGDSQQVHWQPYFSSQLDNIAADLFDNRSAEWIIEYLVPNAAILSPRDIRDGVKIIFDLLEKERTVHPDTAMVVNGDKEGYSAKAIPNPNLDSTKITISAGKREIFFTMPGEVEEIEFSEDGYIGILLKRSRRLFVYPMAQLSRIVEQLSNSQYWYPSVYGFFFSEKTGYVNLTDAGGSKADIRIQNPAMSSVSNTRRAVNDNEPPKRRNGLISTVQKGYSIIYTVAGDDRKFIGKVEKIDRSVEPELQTIEIDLGGRIEKHFVDDITVSSIVEIPSQARPRTGIHDYSDLVGGQDYAQLTRGGIDLNTLNNGLSVTKDANGGVTITVDPAMIERIRREGISNATPVIINMKFLPSVNQLLGL